MQDEKVKKEDNDKDIKEEVSSAKDIKKEASSAEAVASELKENEYEVEKIINMKQKGGKVMFEIKWKGYEETTWEPEENLFCDQMVFDFLESKISGKAKKKQKTISDFFIKVEKV